MSRLRRYYTIGNTYFVTSVTHNRIPVLIDNSVLLLNAIESVNNKNAFEIIAWVILPDHFHMVINPHDKNLSAIMKKIKLTFSANYRKRTGMTRGRVWQYRFWDHIIRNQRDLNRHIDYIHYNPIKHGLAVAPISYEYSSFHKYVREGLYDDDWGKTPPFEICGDFGE